MDCRVKPDNDKNITRVRCNVATVIFVKSGDALMSSSVFEYNPMGLVLFALPLLTFVISLVMQLLIKKKIIILSIVFVGYLIATFVLFNSTFLIWCFVYTGISLTGTLIADLILKCKKGC